jgi:TonB family protein
MKPLITLLFLLIAPACFAQRQNIYFYKNGGIPVHDRDSADYIRVINEPDSGSTLYNVFEFYINGKPRLTAKSSTIEPQKFEGTCVQYFKNGKRQTVSKFQNGRIIGEEYFYYPNGQPYFIRKYPDSVNADYKSESLIIAEYDTTGKAFLSDGNGYYKRYDAGFSHIIEQGNVKDGKRDGVWKGTDQGLHVSYTETYNNGKIIEGTSVGLNNDTVRYTIRQREPQFKGGEKAFNNFLATHVKYPEGDRKNLVQGKVVVEFVVDRNGKVTEAKIIKNVSPDIDAEALRVVNSSPKWVPGFEYGRPVRVSYTIPLAFNLANF